MGEDKSKGRDAGDLPMPEKGEMSQAQFSGYSKRNPRAVPPPKMIK